MSSGARRRWLTWKPERILADTSGGEPTKHTEPANDAFEGTVTDASKTPLTEEVLKGRAVELYLADGDRLFIVADEADAATLGEPRGTVYTSAEVRCIVQVEDPSVVAEIRCWKREFNATLRGCQKNGRGETNRPREVAVRHIPRFPRI
jgi:hypothetical protein